MAEEPTTDAPVSEEPVAEAPVSDTPAEEAPGAEEPKDDGPISATNADINTGRTDLAELEAQGGQVVGYGEQMKRRPGRKYAISWFNISLIYICPIFIILLLGGSYYLDLIWDTIDGSDDGDDMPSPTMAPSHGPNWDDVQFLD